MKRFLPYVLGAICMVAIAFGAGFAVGQGTAPAANKGLTAVEVGALDMAGQLPNLDGRKMRVRRLTFEPSGATAQHSHANGPGVGYIVQGSLTLHEDNKPDVTRGAGELNIDGKDVNHWVENKDSTPAIVIAIDLMKP
jgi:quercetin dioxygenase-like cupin family protein